MAKKPSKLDRVWDKGKPVRGKNPESWRRDDKGNLIRHGSFGTTGQYGWEKDHKNPKSKGGTDSLRNLRPLHWKENRKKGDKRKK